MVIVLYYGGIHLFKYQIIELYLSMEHKEYVEEEGAFYTIRYHPDDRDKVEKFIEITPQIIEWGELWFKEQDFSEQHLTIYLKHTDDQLLPSLSTEGVFIENNLIV